MFQTRTCAPQHEDLVLRSERSERLKGPARRSAAPRNDITGKAEKKMSEALRPATHARHYAEPPANDGQLMAAAIGLRAPPTL